MEYNPPNTRERIAARRQRLRQPSSEPAIPGWRRRFIDGLQSGRIVSGAVFVVSCLALFYVLFSSQFRVQTVEVVGVEFLSPERIVNAVPLRGWPIWLIDEEQAVAPLLRSPFVEHARLSLILPDRARIVIVERQPVIYWRSGGVDYLVDRQGFVIEPATVAPPADALVIVDSSNLPVEPQMQLDPDALALARELAWRLPNELGLRPAQIGWDFGLGVFIRTEQDQMVVFGRSERLTRKLMILAYLLNDGTPFTYLDLRPMNPFYQNRTDGRS
ncbi:MULTISPECIES: cell division protein FtsQ/DivIB [Chloroflexus]|uniref:Cell division protein FtsQ n=1 Tax=Chloroflexus aggregans (strain MD-66 / DSM 9485) TaxID=326427 RepID=FTSQ_CHLAD|nr:MULTISPECIES: FtsQ-type POTRA domain-containing protein [Chloroflexus]B8G5Y6.1 RecName: Full=Cell division protein FtsQ [Chloroflexus aggregans DSM 9485]ACL25719.1 Polypeptide-transport-associated domain protein FtsQ-type [Chloroflexus aggregans DSM 9485]GIV87941.1 MAG: cell division protein FtsQ [Chloroflexus sp.]